MGTKNRVIKIKQKYGKKAFVTWGRKGGNPVCIAQGQGKKIIIKQLLEADNEK